MAPIMSCRKPPLCLLSRSSANRSRVRQHPFGKSEHLASEFCREHPARQPLEERHPEELLQVMDELRGTRLCEMHSLSGTVEIAVLADRNRQCEMAET
jgi:hypothetical protein